MLCYTVFSVALSLFYVPKNILTYWVYLVNVGKRVILANEQTEKKTEIKFV